MQHLIGKAITKLWFVNITRVKEKNKKNFFYIKKEAKKLEKSKIRFV